MAPIYQTGDDLKRQRAVADRIEAGWNCEVRSLGELSRVDWEVSRDGKIVGYAELKCRNYKSTSKQMVEGVFLSVNKYKSLIEYYNPCLFIQCSDGLFWVRVKDIDETNRKKGLGRDDRPNNGKAHEDMILVPIGDMRRFKIMRHDNPLRCKDCRTRKSDVEYREKYGRQLCRDCIGKAYRAAEGVK